ncbi:MAG TPA: hypothetical protein VGM44_13965, partial [Polyangiaceae bacterium]
MGTQGFDHPHTLQRSKAIFASALETALPSAALLLGLATLACEARTTSIGAYDPPLTIGHAVDASEITPQAVTIFGPVPVFAALTGYASDEPSAAQASQVPLYAPYDSTDPAWW